jgi:hypothetical protein
MESSKLLRDFRRFEMHEKFTIAHASFNRRPHEAANSNMFIDAPRCKSTDHAAVDNRITDHAFLPNLSPASLKLGLY